MCDGRRAVRGSDDGRLGERRRSGRRRERGMMKERLGMRSHEMKDDEVVNESECVSRRVGGLERGRRRSRVGARAFGVERGVERGVIDGRAAPALGWRRIGVDRAFERATFFCVAVVVVVGSVILVLLGGDALEKGSMFGFHVGVALFSRLTTMFQFLVQFSLTSLDVVFLRIWGEQRANVCGDRSTKGGDRAALDAITAFKD